MGSGNMTNYETFLDYVTPRVPVHYHAENRVVQTIGAASSSSVREEGARKAFIGLRDVWSVYEEWSCYGHGVPISLPVVNPVTALPFTMITQYYAPSLSAMQIFTIKPFADGSASSSSGESRSAEPISFGNYSHPYLSVERVGHLYFQYNEEELPFYRPTFHDRITELAEQHDRLYTLTSSDLSPYSWFAVAWYPIYGIPPTKSRRDLSAAFLTYHRLKPDFRGENAEVKEKEVSSEKEGKSGEDDKKNGKGVISGNEGESSGDDKVSGKGVSSGEKGTSGEDGKVNEKGVADITKVGLPPFAAVAYHAFGDVWYMPGTADYQNMERLEEHAFNLMQTFGFIHSDLSFFMSRKANGRPPQ